MVLLWLMIIKFNGSLEFQPCTRTYCIRCCLKIAQGKKNLQPQRGSYLIQKLPSSTPDEKSEEHLSVVVLCFTLSFLKGEIYEAIFMQFLGPICEICLSQLKQVQRHSRCFGNRKWEGVLKSFTPVGICLSVTDGSSSFLPPKHMNLAVVVADFTGLLGQSHHPRLWLVFLTMGPGYRVPSTLGPRPREEQGEKSLLSLFSHSTWKWWWPVKNHHIFLLGKRNWSTEVCVWLHVKHWNSFWLRILSLYF